MYTCSWKRILWTINQATEYTYRMTCFQKRLRVLKFTNHPLISGVHAEVDAISCLRWPHWTLWQYLTTFLTSLKKCCPYLTSLLISPRYLLQVQAQHSSTAYKTFSLYGYIDNIFVHTMIIHYPSLLIRSTYCLKVNANRIGLHCRTSRSS